MVLQGADKGVVPNRGRTRCCEQWRGSDAKLKQRWRGDPSEEQRQLLSW